MTWRNIVAWMSALMVAASTLVIGALPAQAAVNASLEVTKTVMDPQPSYRPGDTFTYSIGVACSSFDADACFDTVLSDTLPEPLVLNPSAAAPVQAQVPGGATATIDVSDERSFTVTPVAGGQNRLTAGTAMTVTVEVLVPTDASADFNGIPIVNVASATAENAEEATAEATVELEIVTTLEAGLAKSVTPTSAVPAVPGRPVSWELTPRNASNQTVDRLVVTDPSTASPGAPFTYLDFDGITDLEAPDGADAVQIEWVDTEGQWHTSYGPGALPSDPDVGLPDPLSEVKGLRLTFTGAIAPGAEGRIGIDSVTNATVEQIPDGQTITVVNEASAVVGKGGVDSAPRTATAEVDLLASAPDVSVTKSFDPASLVSGQATTATITATNGVQDVTRLTVTEPLAGEPSFTEQGLRFTGFGDTVEWPVGAVSASVVYRYADCTSAPLVATERDTLPRPAEDCVVEGFTLTFEAESGADGIVAAGYARLPLELTSLPVTGDEPRSGTNVVGVEVENTIGQRGTDTAAAQVVVSPLQVETEVSKSIMPDQVYAVRGADATISLSGKVADDSTVGSRYLSISDPADPTAAQPFWDTFDARTITTSVPHGVSFVPRYWSIAQQAWVDLEPPLVGPASGHSVEIPGSLREDVGGIQLFFEPVDQELLPPGFAALATVDVDVADGVTVDGPLVVENVARSEVHHEDAVVPTRTADAPASVELLPIDGAGPDLVDKTWLEPDQVPALSEAQRTARLLWSTGGLPMTTMTLTDPASPGELDDVSTSVYDAFDLVRIEAITPSSDPLIAGDRITGVWRYSADAAAWVEITDAVCEAGCEGEFGGYTLTEAEQEDTLGVRLEIREGEDGAGVGSSYTRRPVDLQFQVRDRLRSDAGYVLGQFHDGTYNTGTPGLVENTVAAHGVGPDIDFTAVDGDTILITDEPLNLRMSKTFDQEVLGVPQPGTAAEDYPLIDAEVRATNTTPARIQSMVLTDPAADQAAPNAYDVLDLHQISAITIPEGLAPADVVVEIRTAVGWQAFTYWEALTATPDVLADAESIRLSFTRPGEIAIASGATGGATLTYQLRETKRSGGPVEPTTAANGGPILNRAETQIDSPARIVCPADGCSTGRTVAEDSFDIVTPDYEVVAQKTINRTSAYEDESRAYTSTLRGQPLGNARTTLLTLTDATPTFWNAMQYTGASIVVPRPVNEVRMDVLVGADLTYDGASLSYACDGGSALEDCWVAGAWEAAAPGSTHRFNLPTDVDAGDVLGVRFSFREVVGGEIRQWERPYNPNVRVALATERRELLRLDTEGRADTTPVPTTRPGMAPAPGEPVQGRISNDLQVVGEAQFGPVQRFSDDAAGATSTLLRHRPNAIRVEKSPGHPTTVEKRPHTEPVPYAMTITNTGQWDMTGLDLSDQITPVDGTSPLVEPAGGAQFSFALFDRNGFAQPVDGFTAALDPQTGTVSITTPEDFVFASGSRLLISADLAFRPGLDPNTIVENSITATSDRLFDTCEYSVDTQLMAPTSNVEPCAAVTHVQPRAVAPLEVRKAVRGVAAGDPATGDDDLGVFNSAADGAAAACGPGARDADGFYTAPCVPLTRPGGEQEWRMSFTNDGNADASVVAAIDVLPAPGDQGVIVPGGRGSQWAPIFRGQVEANLAALANGADATVTAYYSGTTGNAACHRNAVQVHTNGDAENTGCGFAWQPVDGASDEQLAGARSVKFVVEFADGGLRPQETLHLDFRTQTPWVLPTAATGATPIAYNSFAGASRRVDVVGQPGAGSTVLEPTKVGVGTATGQLRLSKIVDAPEFAVPIDLPESYPAGLVCTSGGVDVPLSRTSVDVPADGEVLVNDAATAVNLPLFATCTVTETEVPDGVSVSYEPTSQQAVAQRDLSTDAKIHHPYSGDVDGVDVAMTNTFAAGGFTVAKSVDAGGAVDQDGEPIQYAEEYGFTATCTYLGQEAVPADQRSFTLGAGERATFDDVPTGTDCRVTETDAKSSVDRVISVTGASARIVDGNAVEFAVGTGVPAAIEVGYENRYETGVLEVTKQVTGEGADAWGTEEFELRIMCELATTEPTTVYDDTAFVSAAQPLWRVENLPAGADCVVTELGDGGATEFTGGEATIQPSSDGVTPLAVVNRFDIGSITVRKEISGEGAAVDPVQNGTYTMTLTCSREVSGATLPIPAEDIPGGPERVLTGASSATWSGLPAGASCAVAETASVPEPTRVEVAPDQPVTVLAGDDVEVVVENVFDPAWVQIVKDVEGPGGTLSSGEFGFSLVCTVSGQTVVDEQFTLTLAEGETTVGSDVVGPLPIGTECLATETDAAGADRTPEPVQVVLTEGTTAEEPLQLGFTNWYSAGTVQVEKQLAGDGATEPKATDATFTLLATCELPLSDGSRATVLSAELAVRGDTVTTVTGADGEPVLLPLGSHCFLEETDAGEADEVEISHVAFEDAAVVEEGDSVDPQALTLTAVNSFEATPPAPQPATAAGPLPDNGGPSGGLAPLGLVLVLAGAVAATLSIRRRQA